ncbi:phage tail tape measure protein, partial [Bacillus velezensis]
TDQINQYSLDDSEFGKSKVKELTEQLQKEQLDLDEFLKDRESSKRKEALQDQLQKDEDSINKKYDDLVNDERGFKELEKKLMGGKITDIAKQLNEFSKFINSNMESIGKSISNNLVDKLKEASNALNTVTKGNTTGKKISSFETGGYTGTGLGSGKLAILHDKELILNKTDTKNMLETVKHVRNLSDNDLNNETPKWGQGGKLAALINKGITSIPSIIPNITQSNLSNSLIPNVKTANLPPTINSTGDKTVNLTNNFNIEQLTGGETGARTMFETIKKEVIKLNGSM